MEKVNEVLISISGAFIAFFWWIVRRLFKSVDKAHDRITTLEKSLVDRDYLENQLAPIRKDLNIITSHLLDSRQNKD